MNYIVVIALIVIVVAVFLLLREVVCWYFKINERIELLRDIREALESRSLQKRP